MGQAIYVENELIPLAEIGKEIMVIFRDHLLAGSLPVVFMTALQPNTQLQLRSGPDGNTDAFTATTTITLADRGSTNRATLPVGGATLDRISAIRVMSGSATITINSSTRVTAEFRTRKHP